MSNDPFGYGRKLSPSCYGLSSRPRIHVFRPRPIGPEPRKAFSRRLTAWLDVPLIRRGCANGAPGNMSGDIAQI